MNYISLGYFCSIASDLEKLGLRNQSSPFDWCISDLEGVILAIKDGFVDFTNYKYLKQNAQNRNYYKNIKYNIQFFHDFDKYKTLRNQLPAVSQKYNRRIEKFYKTISQPTVFIRYINDEQRENGISNELTYIENNYNQIIDVLKSYNINNEIIFIANEGVEFRGEMASSIKIYNVKKDSQDVVSRNPLYSNEELYTILSNVDVKNKAENIERYQKKEKHKNRILYRIKIKVINKLKKIFLKEYIHPEQYN